MTRQGGARDGGHQPSAGSGQPSSRAKRLTGHLPYALVVAGVLAGLATIRSGDLAVRSGTLVMAGAVLAGALARLVLPESKAGMLSARHRLIDVAVLVTLGVGLLIAGLIAKVPGS